MENKVPVGWIVLQGLVVQLKWNLSFSKDSRCILNRCCFLCSFSKDIKNMHGTVQYYFNQVWHWICGKYFLLVGTHLPKAHFTQKCIWLCGNDENSWSGYRPTAQKYWILQYWQPSTQASQFVPRQPIEPCSSYLLTCYWEMSLNNSKYLAWYWQVLRKFGH